MFSYKSLMYILILTNAFSASLAFGDTSYNTQKTHLAPNRQVAKEKLHKARKLLTGKDKQTEQAQKLLLDLAENYKQQLSSSELCCVYVYIGYIEDIDGNRKDAIRWFNRGIHVRNAKGEGIWKVAQQGLKRPVTHLKHLDAPSSNQKSERKSKAKSHQDVVDRIGKAIVLKNEPKDLAPKAHLSAQERMENFELLWEAIDRNYSFFVHKQIDWGRIKLKYSEKVRTARTTKEFYFLLWQMVRELQDAHSWLCNYNDVPHLPRFSPDVSTRYIEDKAVVVNVSTGSEAYRKGLRAGTIITGVDDKTVARKVEILKGLMKVSSSERNFFEEAYRNILCGNRGSIVKVDFIALGQTEQSWARLKRNCTNHRYIPVPEFQLTKDKFIWYGTASHDCGYIRIVSFSGREEIADEFDTALEKLQNTKALIIDVRDNPGGFGTSQPRIIGRFIQYRTKVNIEYRKNGPGRKDFMKNECYFEPTGSWQYKKPVALLINAVTGSATDLFVCRFISTARPLVVGSTTHGNLTGGGVYVALPCNLVVRVSHGYVCDATGKIIECNGNEPHIHVNPTLIDIVNTKDVVIDRAIQKLRQKLKQS